MGGKDEKLGAAKDEEKQLRLKKVEDMRGKVESRKRRRRKKEVRGNERLWGRVSSYRSAGVKGGGMLYSPM